MAPPQKKKKPTKKPKKQLTTRSFEFVREKKPIRILDSACELSLLRVSVTQIPTCDPFLRKGS